MTRVSAILRSAASLHRLSMVIAAALAQSELSHVISDRGLRNMIYTVPEVFIRLAAIFRMFEK